MAVSNNTNVLLYAYVWDCAYMKVKATRTTEKWVQRRKLKQAIS